MKNIIKYILILIILSIIFIILNFYNSNKNILEDILVFGLWDNRGKKNEYEINSQNSVEIDVFTTINSNKYKKIAPGSYGSFSIKFKRPENSSYKVKIDEKTSKPQNLIFLLENKKYSSLEEMEDVINQKFINSEKIVVNWEWKYYIDDIKDIQDTKDGERAEKYIFEIKAIAEQERT